MAVCTNFDIFLLSYEYGDIFVFDDHYSIYKLHYNNVSKELTYNFKVENEMNFLSNNKFI